MWSSDLPPAHWRVTLVDGTVVDVWADSVEGLSGREDVRDYRFANLIDVPEAEQDGFEIVGRTPSNAERVLVTVARFPRAAVAEVHTA